MSCGRTDILRATVPRAAIAPFLLAAAVAAAPAGADQEPPSGADRHTVFDGRYRRVAAAGARSCEEVSGVDTLPLDRMILFGELHGTDRSPAAFGAVACRVARERGGLVVGLEISHREQERIERFLAGDGGPEARRGLLAGEFWSDHQDGRQSRAMLALLDRLRLLRQEGEDVAVVAFDPLPAVDPAAREEHLARRLAAARQQHAGRPFLVLTGNLHGRTVVGTPWDADFLPMGARLERAGVEVWGVDLRHAGGTAWLCLAGDAAGCGARSIGGSGTAREELLLEPFAKPEAETGYRAALWVGRIEASPPAVESEAPRGAAGGDPAAGGATPAP